MRLQRLAMVFTFAFGVTLALVVGQRLGAEAMAVIVGVVAGVAASIPTSLIVIWVARNALGSPARNDSLPERHTEAVEREPKVIVMPAPPVSCSTHSGAWPMSNPFTPYLPASQPRQFTVIGGEATEDEDLVPWR